ncbi:glycosyltransferase family 4 protein [Enterococcus eurekensis]|uniref:Glycosyltransferase family 4 protein n=1 Tax=Enterococcus eurekensis TaxID=1159753 RepID=A0ABV9M300_9ENTE
MKFILISPKNRTVYNFRGDLIKEIQAKGYDVIVTGPNDEGIKHIQELGVRFEKIKLDKTGINIIADLQYTIKLLRFFKSEKPDAILSYTIKPVIYGSIAAKLAGIKNINSMITGVGYVFTAETFKAKIIRFFASLLYKLGLNSSTNVIFQNSDDMKEFIDRGLIKEKKCRLVSGSGVNMENFKPTLYPDNITFFMLSRVLYSKGIREYLEAAKKVKIKYPNVTFMLLGAVENMQDSMSMTELKPYIEKGIIEYFGETNDVSKYYAKASVFVLPSYREGTPRTVLEAMAMARPIITTNAPGCRGTVNEGENGFLVPIKDINLLAEKMEWFIKNPEMVVEMGKASLNLCQTRFNVDKVNHDMIKYMNL